MKLLHASAFLFAAALGSLVSGAAHAATLYISEFANGVSTIASQEAQIFPQPAITDQTVAITASSVQSAAFNSKTKAIMVECDADCSVVIGTNPTATTSNYLMGDGTPYYFAVGPGEKIAVISNTSGGSGSDVNIVAVGGTPVTSPLPVSTPTGASSNMVQGTAAAGSTPVGNPVFVGGSDGTNVRALAVDVSGNQIVVGNAASGAADTGNPVSIGGVFNTTPTVITNGQRGEAQLDSGSNLRVALATPIITGTDGVSNTNGITTPYWVSASSSTIRPFATAPFDFNGTTWDRHFTCANSATITVSAATTTQIIALSAGAIIRVCSFELTESLAGTAAFVYGTGTNCAAGQVALTGAMALVTGGNLPMSSSNGSLFRTIASNALCLTAVTGNITGFVTYAQY